MPTDNKALNTSASDKQHCVKWADYGRTFEWDYTPQPMRVFSVPPHIVALYMAAWRSNERD